MVSSPLWFMALVSISTQNSPSYGFGLADRCYETLSDRFGNEVLFDSLLCSADEEAIAGNRLLGGMKRAFRD